MLDVVQRMVVVGCGTQVKSHAMGVAVRSLRCIIVQHDADERCSDGRLGIMVMADDCDGFVVQELVVAIVRRTKAVD